MFDMVEKKCFCKFIDKCYNEQLRSSYSPKDIYNLVQLFISEPTIIFEFVVRTNFVFPK